MHDVVIVGAGPAGLTASITAANAGASVLLLERGPGPGRKLLASGGGRCNVTNTLPPGEFMSRFGRYGRFMQPALERLGSEDLRAFLHRLGVQTHAPDGFHVFPTDHNARSVLAGLLAEVRNRAVTLRTGAVVTDLVIEDDTVRGVRMGDEALPARAVVLACGGCGYPALGGDLAGCRIAAAAGHAIEPPHPGMVPLVTDEDWPARCTADTVARATLSVRRRGKARIAGTGDLIFTRTGLAGPVVLDLSREITPLLAAAGEMIVDLELTGRNQSAWLDALERGRREAPRSSIAAWLTTDARVADSLGRVLGEQAGVDPQSTLERLGRKHLARLAEKLARTQVTVVSHAGWDRAMVMRGGVSLRDVRPKSLASRHLQGLFFAGEMLDLDGPCGGFNLQWAFASGHLAGSSAASA